MANPLPAAIRCLVQSSPGLTVLLLIFPNQLYRDHPGLKLGPRQIVLIEDSLFFGDPQFPARFHKQKLWLHRASMKRYADFLADRGFRVTYLEYDPQPGSLDRQLEWICRDTTGSTARLSLVEPVDFELQRRLDRFARRQHVPIQYLNHPGFLNQTVDNQEFRGRKNRWRMADFYKWQRLRLRVLVDDGDPVGGQWSFDSQNRKKIPKHLLNEIPELLRLQDDEFDREAREYVQRRFPDNPGSLENRFYPTSHDDAQVWLQHFLQHRLIRFGDYEDAIEPGESWLWHSVLTPALNIGLLTPQQVLDETLSFSERHAIPLNSLEGFVRQLIGWREFMRATYEDLGVAMRTTNHWGHRRAIPDSFYNGTTGIPPIDQTIGRLLTTGYCHHIERLMLLGGFMFLCEFDPDHVYRWFMEMFVDSYDWVMVPNVYSMSQHADGGLITTKPYFSGSSYILKMSHHAKGPWCATWDGLYWRWIWKHVDLLSRNPRWAMMCATAKKMDSDKRELHLRTANRFLAGLSG